MAKKEKTTATRPARKRAESKKAAAKRAEGRKPSKPKTEKKPVTRDTVRENIRCRSCLIVDGYTKEEGSCRHCGAKLFKGDVL